ncbi:hypothetical protein C7999DRAFT_13395 [Corynascus novoguineensis]|uniref:Amidoligase enzyme n=1 Tax=Corynascus novoguineensis TaxID=1126955 RepID=A0AAN7HK74_9PEZI|nr:hypothetical protein C7999DRAFT_13395 [Corynascus novoguineensis]
MNQAGWDQRVDSVDPKYESDAIKKQRAQNRFAVRYALASILSAAGIPATPKQTADYQSWSIVDEESLDEIPQYCEIEFVSRVLSTNIDWQKELRSLFRVLHAECKLRLTTGCSMHVHVSPYDGRYTAEHLRKICKALCYFDNAITRVMPAERKNNCWATSNVSGRGVAVNQKLKKAYSLLPAQSWKYLFELFDKTVTPKHVYQLLSGNYESRYVSWNFENVTQPCGTVEFRRPPGADSAAKAIHWAGFTLGFVARALAMDWAPFVSLKTVGSVTDLEQFIIQGLQKLGPTSQPAALGRRIVEDTSAPTVLTPAQLSAIERKKKNKDKSKSPFVEKASRSSVLLWLWQECANISPRLVHGPTLQLSNLENLAVNFSCGSCPVSAQDRTQGGRTGRMSPRRR